MERTNGTVKHRGNSLTEVRNRVMARASPGSSYRAKNTTIQCGRAHLKNLERQMRARGAKPTNRIWKCKDFRDDAVPRGKGRCRANGINGRDGKRAITEHLIQAEVT